MIASVLACLVGIELGACCVTLETELSGITALPTSTFLAVMTGIHLAIGLGEGLATGAILCFVLRTRPDLLATDRIRSTSSGRRSMKNVLIGFGIATIALGGGLAFFASEYPDGLEWSIQKLTGSTELAATHADSITTSLESVQKATSVMPDYDSSFSGILGALMVIILVWSITSLLTAGRRRRLSSEG